MGHRDTKHNDTRHNDIHHNGTKHKGLIYDAQDNNAAIMQKVIMPRRHPLW
jgi:hypothetical protein